MFSGHSPESTREIVTLVFRQNLKRARNRPYPWRRWEAAANTLHNRYRTFNREHSFPIALAEVLPFVLSADAQCERLLADYLAYLEHENIPDDGWLRDLVNEELEELFDDGDPAYDIGVLQLAQVNECADPFVIPWRVHMTDQIVRRLHAAADAAIIRLAAD